jgi:hypothetical protein
MAPPGNETQKKRKSVNRQFEAGQDEARGPGKPADRVEVRLIWSERA